MQFKLKMFMILTVCFLCTGTIVLSNGFFIYEQGARAAGMANAFVARASDPSAVWYNPAGIIQLEGLQIYTGGISLNIGERKYYSIYRDKTLAADSISNIFPNIYISYKLSDKIGLGLGINSPINYEIEWPQTSEIEHLVYILRGLEIRSIAMSPVIAVKLSNRLSLGAGINLYSIKFNSKYHYPYDTNVLVAMLTNGEVMDVPDTIFDLNKFKTNRIGFFTGLQWRLTPVLSLGATYRRGTPLTFNSGNVRALEPDISNAYAKSRLSELFPDSPQQSAEITFRLVDQLNTGIALKIGNSFEIEFDFSYVFLSQMDNLSIDYGVNTYFGSVWSGYSDQDSTTNFKDTISLQLGGEYKLSPAIDLRCGVFRHGTPLDSPYRNPAFPFSDSIGFSFGLGYHTNNFNMDMAYVYKSTSEIEDVNNLLSRWGDTSQKYLSRTDNYFFLNVGIRF